MSTYHPTTYKVFNNGRIYYRVIYHSDISNATGTHVDKAYRHKPSADHPRRLSHLRWPNITTPPTRSQWDLWESIIKTYISDNHFKLQTSPGAWLTATHQHWPVRLSATSCTLQLHPFVTPIDLQVTNKSRRYPTYQPTHHPSHEILNLIGSYKNNI